MRGYGIFQQAKEPVTIICILSTTHPAREHGRGFHAQCPVVIKLVLDVGIGRDGAQVAWLAFVNELVVPLVLHSEQDVPGILGFPGGIDVDLPVEEIVHVQVHDLGIIKSQ